MTVSLAQPVPNAAFLGIARHRLIALGLLLVHCAWFASTVDNTFDAQTLTTTGFIAFVLYSGFLVAEYRWNGLRVTPILFYLGAGVFRLGTGALFVATAAVEGEWPLVQVGIHDVSQVLGYGHLLILLGDWCFIAGYVAVSSLSKREFLGPSEVSRELWGRVGGVGIAAAIAAFVLRLGQHYVSLGGLASLTNYLSDYGVAAGVFLTLLASRHGGGRGRFGISYATIAYCLLGLSLMDALYSYMKTDILLGILPLVVLGFERAGDVHGRGLLSRLVRPVAGTMLVLYMFLFVVSSYSSLRRPDFWGAHSGSIQAQPHTVAVTLHLFDAIRSAVPGTAEFREAHGFPYGVWQMIGRMSFTAPAAWIYREVESAGFRQAGFVEELLLAVAPRVLWPDKPLVRPGVEFAVAVGQSPNVDSATSSMAMTMQGGWYWRGGYAWLVAGCALSGAAFALVWLLFRNEIGLNPASAIIGLMLCHEGFRWLESASLGGIPNVSVHRGCVPAVAILHASGGRLPPGGT